MDYQYHADVGNSGKKSIVLDSDSHNDVFETALDEDATHLAKHSAPGGGCLPYKW